MSAAVLVDARGLRCPWPVIRLSRAARELGGAGRIRMIADDPIAPAEMEALCAERGWRLERTVDPDTFEITIRTAG